MPRGEERRADCSSKPESFQGWKYKALGKFLRAEEMETPGAISRETLCWAEWDTGAVGQTHEERSRVGTVRRGGGPFQRYFILPA
ncbi:hypothetical protein AAFF_G00349190 [Aldrovandia affinis]|uniref:Uncharacterized protein n=1 Tax=Aldrovandia affinis TaxID=143900 RepID=A0AAD7SJU5_9TELE|nr:hypothetical protein AAFF_G00349190 [Aldrovandia affinis]